VRTKEEGDSLGDEGAKWGEVDGLKRLLHRFQKRALQPTAATRLMNTRDGPRPLRKNEPF
jgi:hypothetical protein